MEQLPSNDVLGLAALARLAAAVATILVVTHGPLIVRMLHTWWSRLYLNCFVLKKKPDDNNEDERIQVTALYTYPVKSLRAVPQETVVIGKRGLDNDRRLMLVAALPKPSWSEFFGPNDATHRFLSQRQFPSMARVVAEIQPNDVISFSTDVMQETCSTSMQPKPDAATYRSTLWNDIVTVKDLGDEAALFFRNLVQLDPQAPDEYKTMDVRLVVQAESDVRKANDKYVPASARSAVGSSPGVSLADGFPLLIAVEESLAELNKRLESKGKDPLPMARFRPNLVIKGAEAFAEDRMKVITIGDVILHVVSSCPRCKESCTDQTTGEVTPEPIETMRDFRMHKNEVYFAVNAVPAPGSLGKTIKLGDPVRVLQKGEPVWGDS